MVDFGKLIREDRRAAPTEPRELFRSLVREPRFEYLRDVQHDVLGRWYTQRERTDAVIKLNTGAGKTVVGLLLLQSSLNEGNGPSLYLSPTKQLVDQVVKDARDLGVAAVAVTGGGPLPVEFLNGERIFVTTFQKLFNGRSVFGVSAGGGTGIQLGAVLVDDAHSCLRIARETVTVTFGSTSPVYQQLFALSRTVLDAQSETKTAEIAQGHPYTMLHVPYWAWQDAAKDVAGLLVRYRDADEMKFSWDLLKDDLRSCHCLFSGQRVEITPHLTPVESIPSFAGAHRRFFLSATLADDSVLLREFGVGRDAIEHTLRPAGGGDIGERMILAPDLIEPGLGAKLPALLKLAAARRNVVVLVPSARAAELWAGQGAVVAQGNAVSDAIERLRNSQGNYVVLVNRYDGIDLPDDACRILVLDGLPAGDSLYEMHVASARRNSSAVTGRVAQTIEQGLGRGVRSGKDYCVVLLRGDHLVNFVSLKRNLNLFSPETREQIDIGHQISKMAQAEADAGEQKLAGLIRQSLDRDEGWRGYHAQRMAAVRDAPADRTSLDLAEAERAAIRAFRSGDHVEAVKPLQKAFNDLKADRPADAGWYLQLAGSLLHPVDPGRAQEMQKTAHDLNPALLRPHAGVRYRRIALKTGLQAERVLNWVRQHTEPNAAAVSVNALLSQFCFGIDHDRFEDALKDIGLLLGFEAQRPEQEFGKGPDALWGLTDKSFVLFEAKNEVSVGRTDIHQAEVEQLSNSVNWFREEYDAGIALLSVLVHPAEVLSPTAYAPDNSALLLPNGLGKLHDRLRAFAGALGAKVPDAWTAEEIARLLTDHQLTPAAIRATYFSSFRRP